MTMIVIYLLCDLFLPLFISAYLARLNMIQAYDIYGYDTDQNMNKWTKLIENKLSMYQKTLLPVYIECI